MEKQYSAVQFRILILLTLFKKSCQSDTCGAKLYSVYQTELNTTCYDTQELDDLPVIDEENMTENSIFFIDASCKGGLNFRKACSVEAASRINPSKQVNVLFSGPVTSHCAKSEPLASLTKYKNVHLYRINVEEFANAAGLGYLLRNLDTTWSYPVLTCLDLLKFVTLYKFAGIYIDLDMLATRSFDELPSKDSWVGIGDHIHGTLSPAIIAASGNSVGRKFIQTLISTLKTAPTSEVGSIHGIKEAVERICGVIPLNKTGKAYSYTCQSLVLYASKFFFPVPCESSRKYFDSKLDMKVLTRSFTQQLCNSLTFEEVITKQSVYAELMSKYCPTVYGILKIYRFKEDVYRRQQEDESSNEVTAGENESRPTKAPGDVNRNTKRKWYYEIEVTV